MRQDQFDRTLRRFGQILKILQDLVLKGWAKAGDSRFKGVQEPRRMTDPSSSSTSLCFCGLTKKCFKDPIVRDTWEWINTKLLAKMSFNRHQSCLIWSWLKAQPDQFAV